MEVIAKLYTKDNRELQIRRKHNYYTIWQQSAAGQQFSKCQSAYARNMADANYMAHHILSHINGN